MLRNVWTTMLRVLVGVDIGLGVLNTPLFIHLNPVDLGVEVVPATLKELTDHAPLIFVGEVEKVDRYLDFAGYAEDGKAKESIDRSLDFLPPSIPTTDFALKVQQVIRDDGAIARGDPIVLRLVAVGARDLDILEKAGRNYTGREYLFLLTPNPDGKTYGFYYGAWSQLTVDGDVLHISNDMNDELGFESDPAPITLHEFVQFAGH